MQLKTTNINNFHIKQKKNYVNILSFKNIHKIYYRIKRTFSSKIDAICLVFSLD